MKFFAPVVTICFLVASSNAANLVILDASTPDGSPMDLVALESIKNVTGSGVKDFCAKHPQIKLSQICNRPISETQSIFIQYGYSLNAPQLPAIAFIGTQITAKMIPELNGHQKVAIDIAEITLQKIEKTESPTTSPTLSPRLAIEGLKSEVKLHQGKPSIIGPKHFRCDMRNHAYIIKIIEDSATSS